MRARALDSADVLSQFRSQFYLIEKTVYMDGNSLGLLSRPAEAAVLRVLKEWGASGVGGWLEADPAWFSLAESVAAKIGPLIGAAAGQTAVANSTSVNLHQLLATLFAPTTDRNVIVSDDLAFPTDIYAIKSHLRLRGLDPNCCLRRIPSRDGLTLDEDDIVSAMTDDVAMIILPSVLYASGQLLNMDLLARAARDKGILIGFDCSHSIGALPHELDAWGVDFAFWCSYKYLNSGPGAIGGLYLNRRHFDSEPGLAGWFGNRKTTQFDMSHDFDPAPDAQRLHIGTPDILSLAALEGSLKVVHEAGIERIRRKSLELTDFLMTEADEHLTEFGVRIVNPRDPELRGGHVALLHPEATRLCKALKAARVVPDFRPPNIIRLAPIALYNTFADCHKAIAKLKEILATGAHLKFAAGRDLVA